MKPIHLILLLLGAFSLNAQLTLNITEVPENTPANDPIYVAGSFQGWQPGESAYQLDNNGDGTYSITINPPTGQLQFKFTRGSWETVEGNENGGFRPDRELNYPGGEMSVDFTVLSWEDLGGGGGGSNNTTAADNVHLLDDDFPIDELNRERGVWIYLPPDYETTNKHYPVLYMHDAQNIFDAYTSFSGEWEVDETLNELFAEGDYGCIVVGIENGGSHRLDEYSPWYNNQYNAGGEGDEYISFIINDLKPHVDANYRTLPNREYTGIMGSSMGGLISHYAGIEHQDVFSKVGAFSCSFWFSQEAYNQVETIGHEAPMKFYYIVGEGEGQGMVDDTNEMLDVMFENGFDWPELFKEIHADGQHSEWYWRREFPDAYEWLFGDLNLTSTKNSLKATLRLQPNPASDRLLVQNANQLRAPRISVFDLSGKMLLNKRLRNNGIDISALNTGVYIVQILEKKEVVFAGKLVVDTP